MDNFNNKKILIAGGTGSFGRAMVQKIINSKLKFSEIRIFSRDEKKQDDMRKKLKNPKIKFYIGDVRDPSSIDNATRDIDYIFHAAALKQVPSCEFYPLEAVKTNILGTQNLIEVAEKNNVKKIVCLSTDKAVYPINAMGISKAMMEKIAISKSLQKNGKTKICVTRYGNVMGSRGSVIPLLINQIKSNEPMTITDPNMTRFMMSMNEAIDLVLYALAKGDNGQTFIKKTDGSDLVTLTKSLMKIFNKKNYPIKIIGVRHGEKLHETLMSREERLAAKENKSYFVISPDLRDLNYDKYFHQGDKKISKLSDYTSSNTSQLNQKKLEKKILNIIR
ncbi:MAG: polysaccharide biosynthesis protein [Candidatus Pelagibacter sp.]